MEQDSMADAIRKAGGGAALAAKLGITKSAVSQWRRVPAEHVLDLERLTGVSRHALRPDVFGPAPVDFTPEIDLAPETRDAA